jgi:hypothetical protein
MTSMPDRPATARRPAAPRAPRERPSASAREHQALRDALAAGGWDLTAQTPDMLGYQKGAGILVVGLGQYQGQIEFDYQGVLQRPAWTIRFIGVPLGVIMASIEAAVKPG